MVFLQCLSATSIINDCNVTTGNCNRTRCASIALGGFGVRGVCHVAATWAPLKSVPSEELHNNRPPQSYFCNIPEQTVSINNYSLCSDKSEELHSFYGCGGVSSNLLSVGLRAAHSGSRTNAKCIFIKIFLSIGRFRLWRWL